MNGAHVEELAPLYALGLLDAHETERLEEHLRDCRRCAELVGRAEADAAVLAAAESQRAAPLELELRVERMLRRDDAEITAPARHRPSVRFLAAALAAGFVLGIIPAVYFLEADRSQQNAPVSDSSGDEPPRPSAAPHRDVSIAARQRHGQGHVRDRRLLVFCDGP